MSSHRLHAQKTPLGQKRSRRGLTMLEVIISMTLVATIMLVSLTASANMMRNRVAAARGVQAEILAGYFLDEISTLAFRDPSDESRFGREPSETGSDRSSYNDIDDFDGFQEVSPTFRDGQSIPGYDGWTVNAAIYSLSLSGASLRFASDDSSQFRLIGITVTDPEGQSKTYRSIVSLTSSDRSEYQSYEHLRRLEVQFSNDRSFDVVVPLRNTPAPVY